MFQFALRNPLEFQNPNFAQKIVNTLESWTYCGGKVIEVIKTEEMGKFEAREVVREQSFLKTALKITTFILTLPISLPLVLITKIAARCWYSISLEKKRVEVVIEQPKPQPVAQPPAEKPAPASVELPPVPTSHALNSSTPPDQKAPIDSKEEDEAVENPVIPEFKSIMDGVEHFRSIYLTKFEIDTDLNDGLVAHIISQYPQEDT